MDDKTGVHGLPAKWRAEAKEIRELRTPYNYELGVADASDMDADELEAALRQSGEAVAWMWRNSATEECREWMVTTIGPDEREIAEGFEFRPLVFGDTVPPATSGLVEALLVVRDVLAASPIDCLGEDEAADGMPYPIRDEVIDRISKALAAQDERGG